MQPRPDFTFRHALVKMQEEALNPISISLPSRKFEGCTGNKYHVDINEIFTKTNILAILFVASNRMAISRWASSVNFLRRKYELSNLLVLAHCQHCRCGIGRQIYVSVASDIHNRHIPCVYCFIRGAEENLCQNI
jgi:hypothetical protein